jgi:hypothetical protein
MANPRPNYRRTILLTLGLALAVAIGLRLWWKSSPAVTIGVEGVRVVEIAGPELHAVPFTFGDPIALRIASTQPIAKGHRYDLRYMAYGPGEFDLADYLVDITDKRPADLKKLAVKVDSILPEDHAGELFNTPTSPIDLHSSYSAWMWLLWGTWLALLVPLYAYGRKHKPKAVKVRPAPTIPQRLRTLLERAQRTNLTVEEQADVEKLLLAFWAARLGVSRGRLEDALEDVRKHPAAGKQVQRLERWLHSRDPQTGSTVARELLGELAGEWNTSPSAVGGRP